MVGCSIELTCLVEAVVVEVGFNVRGKIMGSMGHSGSRAAFMRGKVPRQGKVLSVPPDDRFQQDSFLSDKYGANSSALRFDLNVFTKRQRKVPSVERRTAGNAVEKVESPLVYGYPLEKYRAALVNTIRDNTVTIVSAPTGTGKSTLLPLFLLEEGYHVISTNPRRAPCEENGRRVAFLHDTEVGECVGFRHGKAKEASDNVQVVFSTEGYEYRRLLHSNDPIKKPTIYILDELHENTQEGHVILALLRERIVRGEPIKIVVTSATIGKEPFVQSFAEDGVTPVFFEIPDKQKPINDRAASSSLTDDILRGSKSTLVFVPGKRQIEALIAELDHRAPSNYQIFGLHGEMQRPEQREAINYIPQEGEVKVIIATKIAQSSLTPLGMERVICTGFDRFEELDDEGVRSLVIRPDSQNMYNQKRGRVGRITEGEFIYHGALPYEQLDPSDKPQMKTQPIHGIVLDVAKAKQDLERFNQGAAAKRDFEWFNNQLLYPAPKEHIAFARQSLYRNNLLGPQGHITNLGREVVNLPLSVHAGIVVAKAREISAARGLSPDTLLLPAISVAAVMEAQGILTREARLYGSQPREGRFTHPSARWRRYCFGDMNSDHIAQMQVLEALLNASPEKLEDVGIHLNHFQIARDTRNDVCERLSIDPGMTAKALTSDTRLMLLESIYAQYDRWWRVIPSRRGSDRLRVKPVVGDGSDREIAAGSLVPDEAAFVVGEPINIENEPYDADPSKLLMMVSQIPLAWVKKHTPPAQVKSDIQDALSRVIKVEPTQRTAHRPNYPRRGFFGRR